MYRGQGKVTSNISVISVTTTRDNGENVKNKSTNRITHGGLDHPCLDDTNEDATGDGKQTLHKQNKQRRKRLKAAQQIESHWVEHTGQVTYKSTPLPRSRGEY